MAGRLVVMPDLALWLVVAGGVVLIFIAFRR